MERTRGRNRRGGSGGGRRPYRGRGSGGDREFAHRGHRETPREHPGPREAEKQDVADVGEVQETNAEQPSGFSRRKILSNWDRYEATEKETETEVLQRGTDYNVLLSSAGDAFTQFRFADEKEWGAENLSSNQDSSFYLDSQCLVRALQELPLHLRLNVEAELVQEELPQELPQSSLKTMSTLPQNPSVQKSAPSMAISTQEANPLTKGKPSQDLAVSGLDEELDFLLSLETPVKDVMAESPVHIKEHDQQVTCDIPATSSLTDVPLSEEEKQTTVSPEDLEDWLDSMIA